MKRDYYSNENIDLLNEMIQKFEKDNVNFDEANNDYERLMRLNKHIDKLFKKRSKGQI